MRDFSSAEEVLSGKNLPPDSCLVVDYYLPGMNGLELVARLRDRGTAARAVLITSSNNDVRNKAAAFGVIMVEKPMLAGPLLNAIRAAFGDETTPSP